MTRTSPAQMYRNSHMPWMLCALLTLGAVAPLSGAVRAADQPGAAGEIGRAHV